MPHRPLAELAAYLAAAGHRAEILDLGTVDTLESLCPRAVRRIMAKAALETAREDMPSMAARWGFRGPVRVLRKRMEQLCADTARELAARTRLDAVVMLVRDAADALCAAAAGDALRARRPEVPIALYGRWADLHAEALLDNARGVDCVFASDSEPSVLAWLEARSRPREWLKIPNLTCRGDGAARRGVLRSNASSGALLPPAYDPETYPACGGNGKLKVFEIRDSRGDAVDGRYAADLAPYNAVSVQPVSAVCEEISRLRLEHGASAFHFSSRHTPFAHAVAVARGLLAHKLDLVFSRRSAFESADSAGFGLLAASGCVALSFHLDSGSQRLLDRHYGRSLLISEAEKALIASRRTGMFTVVGVCYPCSDDDRHSLAETVRVLARTVPDGAMVRLPVPEPCSERGGLQPGSMSPPYMRALRLGRVASPLYPYRYGVIGSIGGCTARAGALAVLPLVTAARQHGIAAGVTETQALVARFLGHAGGEGAFWAEATRRLIAGDVEWVRALVDVFNQNACSPVRAAQFLPYEALLPAVGN